MTTDEVYKTFTKGTRIKVTRCTSYKKHDYTGKFGTVLRCVYSEYGTIIVELDGESNPYGSTGSFYFKPYELELVKDFIDIGEETNMENVTNYLNIAKIEFVDGNNARTFDYANFEPGLQKGDLCVVKSAHHGLGLAKVVEIIERNDIKTPREIVAKVDTVEYDTRVARREEAAKLKAQMEERAKQLQDIALYQMLAENDPAMKELLVRYQDLRKA